MKIHKAERAVTKARMIPATNGRESILCRHPLSKFHNCFPWGGRRGGALVPKLLLTLAFTLTACSFINPPCIRVGATRSQIQQAIANPQSWFVQTRTHPHDLRIHAGFEKNVCCRIKYISVNQQRISDHSIAVILSLNSRGVAWIVQQTPVHEGKVYYRSADGNYRAVLTDGKELFVITEALFQKTYNEQSN